MPRALCTVCCVLWSDRLRRLEATTAVRHRQAIPSLLFSYPGHDNTHALQTIKPCYHHPSATSTQLVITLDAQPSALRSTRNRPRRAVRRGAAWPAERSSSWLVVREAVSRWQVAHRRAVMVAKRRRRCPQDRWGGPAHACRAWWPRRCGCRPCLRQRVGVLGQRPESSVWCGCPASRVPVHAAAVRCPVRASERPGVRCPAWVSSVRGFPRPLCPTGRLWRGRWGRQPHGWDGRRGRRPCPRPVRRLPGSEPGGRGWRRPCWASGGVGLDFAVVVGAGRGSGWVDRVGDRDGLDGRGDRPLVASRGCAAKRRLRCVVIVCGSGPGRLVAASLLGWAATCACGRGAAAECSERRRLDAGDALTCGFGGGGEGI
jgi:hypothetical protein